MVTMAAMSTATVVVKKSGDMTMAWVTVMKEATKAIRPLKGIEALSNEQEGLNRNVDMGNQSFGRVKITASSHLFQMTPLKSVPVPANLSKFFDACR
jgi:hypothetical protein